MILHTTQQPWFQSFDYSYWTHERHTYITLTGELWVYFVSYLEKSDPKRSAVLWTVTILGQNWLCWNGNDIAISINLISQTGFEWSDNLDLPSLPLTNDASQWPSAMTHLIELAVATVIGDQQGIQTCLWYHSELITLNLHNRIHHRFGSYASIHLPSSNTHPHHRQRK